MNDGNLINSFVVAYGLMALSCMFMIYSNRGRPWEIGNLFASCFLIILSAFLIGLIDNFMFIAKLLHVSGKINPKAFQELNMSSSLWLIVFPLAVGGVGVNVLASFLQAKKPEKT